MVELKDTKQIETSELVREIKRLHDQVRTLAKQSREHQDHGASRACNLVYRMIERKFSKYLRGGE